MGYEVIKQELIEWLSQLEDPDTIEYLKILKDSEEAGREGEKELSPEVMEGIKQGLKDIDEGKVTPHEEVVKKYGL